MHRARRVRERMRRDRPLRVGSVHVLSMSRAIAVLALAALAGCASRVMCPVPAETWGEACGQELELRFELNQMCCPTPETRDAFDMATFIDCAPLPDPGIFQPAAAQREITVLQAALADCAGGYWDDELGWDAVLFTGCVQAGGRCRPGQADCALGLVCSGTGAAAARGPR